MIEKIKEALEKVTTGEWWSQGELTTWYGERVGYWVMGENFIERPDGGIYGGATFAKKADADFVAKSPVYIRYLLDELEKADKEIAKYHKLHDDGYNEMRIMRDELEKKNKEIEKVTLERDNENWRAIWYEGHVEDASRSAAYWQRHYSELRTEHTAMKDVIHQALTSLQMEQPMSAESVLEEFVSTLSKEESHE